MTMLRDRRGLVSSTFSWLMILMHAALVGIMLFIAEIVGLFGVEIAKAQQQGLTEPSADAALPVADSLAFAGFDTQFIYGLVVTVVLVLTVVNSFVPNAASGGDKYKLCLYGAIMLFITGFSLTMVPVVSGSIFGNILSDVPQPGGGT